MDPSYLVEVINWYQLQLTRHAKIVAEKAVFTSVDSRLTESINQAYDGASPFR